MLIKLATSEFSLLSKILNFLIKEYDVQEPDEYSRENCEFFSISSIVNVYYFSYFINYCYCIVSNFQNIHRNPWKSTSVSRSKMNNTTNNNNPCIQPTETFKTQNIWGHFSFKCLTYKTFWDLNAGIIWFPKDTLSVLIIWKACWYQMAVMCSLT